MESSIERLKELCSPVFTECGVRLYEMQWTGSGKNRTLEVSIMHNDGTMDLDTCAEVSEKLSAVLDSCDFLSDAYMLEVCSPGAEREIRDLEELKSIPEPYVFIRLKHPVKNMTEITGDVLSVQDGVMTISYRDKAATRKAEVPVEEIDYIRMAVKF